MLVSDKQQSESVIHLHMSMSIEVITESFLKNKIIYLFFKIVCGCGGSLLLPAGFLSLQEEWEVFFTDVCRLLILVASLVEHRLQAPGLQ